MSLRFNKEPINLIHRIPSQKQIDEARPVPPPYGQLFLEIAAKCWRTTVEFLVRVKRYQTLSLQTKPASQDNKIGSRPAHIATQADQIPESLNNETAAAVAVQEADVLTAPEPITVQQTGVSTVVQADVVSELRSFLIKQQDQIAHLSEEIGQLKSLVLSQQQVLVHLGQELEADAFPTVATGMGPNPAKRGRVARKTPSAKDKPLHAPEPESQSLNL